MDSRVKYKERKSSFRIIHRFNLLNCRTLVVEKQHGMLERSMFWKPAVLSLNRLHHAFIMCRLICAYVLPELSHLILPGTP